MGSFNWHVDTNVTYSADKLTRVSLNEIDALVIVKKWIGGEYQHFQSWRHNPRLPIARIAVSDDGSKILLFTSTIIINKNDVTIYQQRGDKYVLVN